MSRFWDWVRDVFNAPKIPQQIVAREAVFNKLTIASPGNPDVGKIEMFAGPNQVYIVMSSGDSDSDRVVRIKRTKNGGAFLEVTDASGNVVGHIP